MVNNFQGFVKIYTTCVPAHTFLLYFFQSGASNSRSENNPFEIVIQINTEKCKVCKSRYDKWFDQGTLNIQAHCPCIFSLCEKCSEEVQVDEYCALDNHQSLEHYLEGLESERGKILFFTEKIPFL